MSKFADTMHQRLFGHAMSPAMAQFLRHLSWSALGGMIGSGLLFLTQATAGRVLGPEEFGRASLALTIGAITSIVVVLGMDLASGRAISRATTDAQRSSAITYSTAIVLAAAVFWSGVAVFAHGDIGHVLSAPGKVVLFGMWYGAALGLRIVAERHIASLHDFRRQSMVRICEGGLAIVGFATLAIATRQQYSDLLIALVLALAVSCVWYGLALRRYYHLGALREGASREMVSFGRLAFVGYLPPLVFLYLDKLLLQRELGAATLGLYTAYYLTSFGVTAQLAAITSNVLFPSLATIDDKGPLVRKVHRLTWLGIMPLIAGLFVVSWLLLLLFGATYDVQLEYVGLFAVLAAVSLVNAVLVNIVNVHSEASFQREVMFQLMRAVFYAATLFALVAVEHLTIVAVAVALLVFEVLEYLNLRLIIATHVFVKGG